MLGLVLLTFLPALLVLLLAVIPTKGLVIGRAPRIWALAGGTLGFVAGAVYFGVKRTERAALNEQTGEVVAEMSMQVELLMAGLGGLFGCFAGVVMFQSGRTILLRAMHNGRRLIVSRR